MNITGGEYNGRKLNAPESDLVRPTLSKVRMGVFNVLYSLLGRFDDKVFFDMFGGSGIMGLEALSRGFDEVVVCEKNPQVIKIIKTNYNTLGLAPNIIKGDSLKYINNTDKKFDVVYADPPYSDKDAYTLLLQNIHKVIKPEGILVVEHINQIKAESYTLYKTKNYGGKQVSFFILQQ